MTAVAERLALGLHRLADVLEEVDGVAHERVVLLGRQLAGLASLNSLKCFCTLPCASVWPSQTASCVPCSSHSTCGIAVPGSDEVVHAGRPWPGPRRTTSGTCRRSPCRVLRAISDRSGGATPNQRLRVVGVACRCVIVVVRRLAREHQVLDQLLLGEADVGGHAVVAHVLGRVAAEAVVDEVRRAALQRRLVVDVVVRLLDVRLAARGEGRRTAARPARRRTRGSSCCGDQCAW